MAKIYANNKKYNGVSATVQFSNGVGEISDSNPLVNWFIDKEYKVEFTELCTTKTETKIKETETDVEESEGDPISPYANMHKAKLVKLLLERGIVANERMKKNKLIELAEGAINE